jgi:hypothetical protein
MSDGSLGAEIERRSAEIRNWPDWAQPYNPPQPPSDGSAGHPPVRGDQPPGDRSHAETQPPANR